MFENSLKVLVIDCLVFIASSSLLYRINVYKTVAQQIKLEGSRFFPVDYESQKLFSESLSFFVLGKK